MKVVPCGIGQVLQPQRLVLQQLNPGPRSPGPKLHISCMQSERDLPSGYASNQFDSAFAIITLAEKSTTVSVALNPGPKHDIF